MLRVYDATMIGIRADFSALLGARHHMSLDLQALYLVLNALTEFFICDRSMRRVEAAANGKIAGDFFFANKALQPLQRCLSLLVYTKCTPPIVFAAQVVEDGFDTGADLSTVAGAAAPTGTFGIQDNCTSTRASGSQGGMEAGVAGTNDNDIGFSRDRGRRHQRRGNVFPPIGVGFEVVSK
jgi:hypothetical protein